MNAVLAFDPGEYGASVYLEGTFDTVLFSPVQLVPGCRTSRKSGKGSYKIQDPWRTLAPLLAALRSDCALPRPEAFVIEGVTSFGQGSTSAFAFGRGVGAWEAAAVALGLPLLSPPPSTWQRFLHGRPTGKDKTPTLAWMRGRWPGLSAQLPRRRVRQEGVADALAMAHWALAAPGLPIPAPLADDLPFTLL